MLTFTLDDAAATEALGCRVARAVTAAGLTRIVVLLEGPLGTGKTTFARGFLRELGETGPIASPTYAIVHPYSAASHADVYRIDDVPGLGQTGLLDAIEDGVWLVEWGSRFPGAWPGDRLEVTIVDDHAEWADRPGRTATVQATGSAAILVCEKIRQEKP